MAALVFLHGVGHKEHDRNWHQTLSRALDVDGLPVHRPWYADLMRPGVVPPAVTLPDGVEPGGSAAYEQTSRDLRARYGRQRWHGPFSLIPGPLLDLGVAVAPRHDADFAQGHRYVREPALRQAVLARVVAALPPEGEVVLLGHSLGSLVAIDLLEHLPPALRVRLLLTSGSPAGLRAMHAGSGRLLRDFPYAAVQSWVNVASRGDPVVAGRGLSRFFPAATDLWISLARRWGHDENDYYRDPVLLDVLRRAL
jgi:pimeloyl-ACP methyl ester carboxylesterase